ncbi:MAG: bifunctional UDP-N-acetylglucosamine diphosphorylase/glucosamine-1-phosphate N-acetyltransferase GlmU [Synechococcus sp. SB0668_bin_15]|nr:bifunctional UDP-N-acetylglucosamine diphosphorylase/glucosamine-1-phosphate N-acetyltransferase GlmU [Synechococcus sp. SB0668_bin_15]MXZ83993.1 bifunctional UDP-N-acetylglucosamine diphosphorylase/glucosamine-1-phosphate N-acetyltransferase GlmU [Synechococcus sp. SB0666_bin_14]MYA91703.1 bifunctional UDP-N-acetylglucosamine diphosphorylase/glucosamine-1-phosphate N-acetyltransferase GlmU [Synechococcus sp. SB0663_bin_10]MYC49440.1 bifunctional UDP-N-acetylglucosamine diphosphorylase/glucos
MLAVAVLAAGKGTRMVSAHPKVLQPLAGATLVDWVLQSCEPLNPQRRLLVVGHQGERVQQHVQRRHRQVEFVLQQPQQGTGHSVQQLLQPLEDFTGTLLVLNGDVPLLRSATLRRLVQRHHQSGSAVTVLTACLEDPKGYGRVFCDDRQRVRAVVEDRDCTDEQRRNRLINAGVYCFHWPALAAVLPRLKTDNQQGELYLTDAVGLLEPATHLTVEDGTEIGGVNDRSQLAACEQVLQQRLRQQWLAAGVSFLDPASCSLSPGTRFGRDVVVEPQTHFRGNNSIGDGCRIGPGALIEDSQLEADVEVTFSVVRQARLARGSTVGPFAHLRPGAVLGEHCKVGNFVEVKNSRLGPDVKAGHLSYLGDARLGRGVNVGAGTVTANFDGTEKHPTSVGEGSSIGANAVLVAPVTLGRDVTVAAGSTITKDVTDDALAVARCRQVEKKAWHKPAAPRSSSSTAGGKTEPSSQCQDST